jgi:hypothetical protein
MAESPYVMQKIEWFQFRAADGQPFFVMVASLPNGFYTALPINVPTTLPEHGLMALAATSEEALAQLQTVLGGRGRDEIFPAGSPAH